MIDRVLDDPALALELGGAAQERVRARYLADRHFVSWMQVLAKLPVGRGAAPAT